MSINHVFFCGCTGILIISLELLIENTLLYKSLSIPVPIDIITKEYISYELPMNYFDDDANGRVSDGGVIKDTKFWHCC